MWVKAKVTQLHANLCNSMYYTVHGILQAIILQWVATPFSRGSSQLRDWTQVSRIAGWFLYQLSHDMVWILLQNTQGQRKGMKLYRLFQCIYNKITLTIVKTKWYIYLSGPYITCIVCVKLSMSLNMLRKNIWKFSEEFSENLTSEKRSDFQEKEIQLHKNTHS